MVTIRSLQIGMLNSSLVPPDPADRMEGSLLLSPAMILDPTGKYLRMGYKRLDETRTYQKKDEKRSKHVDVVRSFQNRKFIRNSR